MFLSYDDERELDRFLAGENAAADEMYERYASEREDLAAYDASERAAADAELDGYDAADRAEMNDLGWLDDEPSVF